MDKIKLNKSMHIMKSELKFEAKSKKKNIQILLSGNVPFLISKIPMLSLLQFRGHHAFFKKKKKNYKTTNLWSSLTNG